MSDLGTKIMAAGLVDEGIEVESLQAEIKRLTILIENQKPICPYCKTIMTPINYQGYYDEFSYWDCDCIDFSDGRKVSGAYA